MATTGPPLMHVFVYTLSNRHSVTSIAKCLTSFLYSIFLLPAIFNFNVQTIPYNCNFFLVLLEQYMFIIRF